MNVLLDLMTISNQLKKGKIDPHSIYKLMLSIVKVLNLKRSKKISVPFEIIDLIKKRDYKSIITLFGSLEIPYAGVIDIANRLGFDLVNINDIENVLDFVNSNFERPLLKGV